MTFTVVREDEPEIVGVMSSGVRNAILETYSLGLIDSDDGRIDPSEKISVGKSLYYAYKLIASAVNLY